MPQPKPSLFEMHAVMQEVAERDEFAMRSTDRPPAPERARRVVVLKAVLHLLAILATFEDKSRAFVAGLLKEHGRE